MEKNKIDPEQQLRRDLETFGLKPPPYHIVRKTKEDFLEHCFRIAKSGTLRLISIAEHEALCKRIDGVVPPEAWTRMTLAEYELAYPGTIHPRIADLIRMIRASDIDGISFDVDRCSAPHPSSGTRRALTVMLFARRAGVRLQLGSWEPEFQTPDSFAISASGVHAERLFRLLDVPDSQLEVVSFPRSDMS